MKIRLSIIILITSLVSFIPVFADFTPEAEKTIICISWVATFLTISIFVFIFLRTGKEDSSKRKRILYKLTLVIGCVVFLFLRVGLVGISEFTGNMWPRKLLASVNIPGTNNKLYLFSYSAFPDPGENVEIKKKKNWVPIMEKIYNAKDFQFTVTKVKSDSIVFVSADGRRIIFLVKEDSIISK